MEVTLDNTPANAPTLLIIPSLINRYYILDLTPTLSLAQYVAQQGIRVLMIDWGEPDATQGDLDAAGYVMDYLHPLLEHLDAPPLHILGYCVGGVLAMALSIIASSHVRSLTLLATPWDFSHTHYSTAWNAFRQFIITDWCNSAPLISGAYISWLFYLADPVRFEEKYRAYSSLPEGSDAEMRFLAVEHWVNDTVPLTSAFARNCLIDWAEHNMTAQGLWQVGEVNITPDKLDCPTLIVAPQKDKVVAPANALALAKHMRHQPHILTPPTGHIGMIIGRDRHQHLWQPLVSWIREHHHS
jgi:polyhydroxyalkanoate synthase